MEDHTYVTAEISRRSWQYVPAGEVQVITQFPE